VSKELDEIWAKIEEQRANYESIIAKANETIDEANETIDEANALKKSAREGLDALPVAKTRRAKKVKANAAD
jgi:hypothetical protein